MSDRMSTPDPLAGLIAELREPIAGDPAAKRRVMEMVREAPLPVAEATVVARPLHRSRAFAAIRRMRGGDTRSSGFSALATAAGIALLLAVGSQEQPASRYQPGRRAVTLGDSVASVAASIRDTLRIVQFMLTAPAASRVALAGDFNNWDPRGTQLARDDRSGRWAVTLALAPGRHRYAYVVDDTQWVRDPVATPAEPNDLTPPRSVLIINR